MRKRSTPAWGDESRRTSTSANHFTIDSHAFAKQRRPHAEAAHPQELLAPSDGSHASRVAHGRTTRSRK